MRVKQGKIRLKMLAAFSFILLVAVCIFGIGGRATVAQAHSGNTDANGGHYEHTQACRNANYNTSHAGCRYHYHSGSSSSSSGIGSNSGVSSRNNNSIPKVSDEDLQAWAKSNMERLEKDLEAQRQANANNGYISSTAKPSNSSDSGGGIVAIVVISLIGLGLLGCFIYKKRKA